VDVQQISGATLLVLQLILQPQTGMKHVPPKFQYPPRELHGVTAQNTTTWRNPQH